MAGLPIGMLDATMCDSKHCTMLTAMTAYTQTKMEME